MSISKHHVALDFTDWSQDYSERNASHIIVRIDFKSISNYFTTHESVI